MKEDENSNQPDPQIDVPTSTQPLEKGGAKPARPEIDPAIEQTRKLPEESRINFDDLKTADIGQLLPPKRTESKQKSYQLFAIVAVLILIAFSANLIKGPNNSGQQPAEVKPQTILSVERGNLSEPWETGMKIQLGDELETKVIVQKPSLAWLAYYSSNGSKLSSDQDISNSIISVNPKISEPFPDRYKFENNQSMDLIVVTVVCTRKALEHLNPSQKVLAEWLDGVMNRDMNFMEGCEGSRVPLI